MNEEERRALYIEIKRDIPPEYHEGIFEVLRVTPQQVQRDAYERMKTEIIKKHGING